MGDFTGSITLDESTQALFEYLCDVRNLPRYFSRMVSAEQAGKDEIKTTAELPDGRKVSGEAWFKVSRDAKRIEWGSEGPSNYSGQLEVSEYDSGCLVEVKLHTTRVESGDAEVQSGVDDTLRTIKRLVEQGPSAS